MNAVKIEAAVSELASAQYDAAEFPFQFLAAPQALELYDKWKTHQGFAGTGIRSIVREGREIADVPDGLIFPILASLSAFAKKTPNGWRISPPPVFRDEEIIR